MKKIVIGLITGVLIIGIAIIGLWIYMQKNNIVDSDIFEMTEEQVKLNDTIQKVEQDGEFYRVKNCIDYYVLKSNEVIQGEQEQEDMDFVYDPRESMLRLLGEDYKEEFGITIENIADKCIGKQEDSVVTIVNMYKIYNSDSVITYFAYGMVRDKTDNAVEGISIMIVIDEETDAFAVYPTEYMKKHGYENMEIGQKLTLPEIKKIENNSSNTSKYVHISNEQAIQSDFSSFQELIVYNREFAYNMLNEEYRNKRFPTYEEFDSYVQKNYNQYLQLQLSQYSTEHSGDTTQYICIDTNNNYYILNEYSAMNFDVQLDIYTLDTTEFLTKYNAGNYQERVVLNLNKVQEALNQGDYRYIYNHLDETFKRNHFATIDVFNHYMEANYFASNVFTFDSYQEAGDVASCTVVLTNGENTAEARKQTFIMKLETGTDFVMSFQL